MNLPLLLFLTDCTENWTQQDPKIKSESSYSGITSTRAVSVLTLNSLRVHKPHLVALSDIISGALVSHVAGPDVWIIRTY